MRKGGLGAVEKATRLGSVPRDPTEDGKADVDPEVGCVREKG